MSCYLHFDATTGIAVSLEFRLYFIQYGNAMISVLGFHYLYCFATLSVIVNGLHNYLATRIFDLNAK